MRPFQHPAPQSGDEPAAYPRGPGNLPAALNRFVGRSLEVAAVRERLDDARVVTVTGVGGVGKSRLVLHAAEELRERFHDGAWLVELAALRDGGLFDHTVIEALGLSDNSGRSPRGTLIRHLRERETLLVLDGCEHLVEECAELADLLLRKAPGLRVLAASRRPLEIAGESVLTLHPMPEAEASELFCERAAAVLPDFGEGATDGAADSATDRATGSGSGSGTGARGGKAGAARGGARPGAIADLCRRLDGIPLALELAAGRLRALSVEQIAHRLDDRFRLLTSNSRSAIPRHQTLRTAIGWSHELCTPQERLLWARLSVFAGDFDLEAAEYLCSGPDLPADQVLSVLEELVAQSVVVRDGREGAAGQARYVLLDTVREYGAQWLEELGEAERLRRRHRDWFLGLATWCELDWFSPRQREIAARMEAGAAQPAARPGVQPGAPRRGTHRPVPRGDAVVLLGRLRAARRGPALAGQGAGAGGRAARGAREGAVGLGARLGRAGRRGGRARSAARVPGAGGVGRRRDGGCVRDTDAGLPRLHRRRPAAGQAAAGRRAGALPAARRAEHPGDPRAGGAGDGARLRRRPGHGGDAGRGGP